MSSKVAVDRCATGQHPNIFFRDIMNGIATSHASAMTMTDVREVLAKSLTKVLEIHLDGFCEAVDDSAMDK